MTEREKEYLPLLKYVMILSDKGIPTTVGSVANTMAIGAIDAKFEDGKWYVAKDELLKRIRQNTREEMEPVEAGYYSIYGFLYHLGDGGIDMDEDDISHLMVIGKLDHKIDKYGRYVIPAHELEKQVKRFV